MPTERIRLEKLCWLPRRAVAPALYLMIALAGLSGCGQKGPLYQPESQAGRVAAPADDADVGASDKGAAGRDDETHTKESTQN